MNGKMKKQSVFAEGDNKNPISSVEEIYNMTEGTTNKLSNIVPTVDKTGAISRNQALAVDYDVVTDFRESYSRSETKGLKNNLVFLIIPPFVIPIPSSFYTDIRIENIAHTAITTKVIHTTAIMKEKIATDVGASVRTVNEAWDAETGQVVLTKTVNEYNDQYYNFNMPAYWAYDQMGAAAENIGITGVLRHVSNGLFSYTDGAAKAYFNLGDELIAKHGSGTDKLWVVGFNDNGTGLILMNRLGQVVNRAPSGEQADSTLNIDGDIRFEIVKSGNKNQQSASMASVTMMGNPLVDLQGNEITRVNTDFIKQNPGTSNAESLRIVNASAVGYTDSWNCQCERGLPSIPFANPTSSDLADLAIEDYRFNPYIFNARGEWRAEKSYAYLTERAEVTQGDNSKVNNRKEGYFKDFIPYYVLNSNNQWVENDITTNKWTFASEVTEYSPYGAELENKDALDRFSSAQYGYNMTLPTAVASNTRYRYMGADNFEDYNYSSSIDLQYFSATGENDVPEDHFSFKKAAKDDGADTGVMVTDEFSHSGLTSLLIPKNDDAKLRRPLKGELPKNLDYDGDGRNDLVDNCPYVSNFNQNDYDGDSIGDLCDDDAIPAISNIDTRRQETYRVKRSFFTIEGKPNDVVRFQTNVLIGLRWGQRMYVNGQEYLSGQIGEVTLDVTGKARVEFIVQGNRPRRKRHRGRTLCSFQLLNKFNDVAVQGTEIRLCPNALRRKRSGNGDPGNGNNPWRCDTRR